MGSVADVGTAAKGGADIDRSNNMMKVKGVEARTGSTLFLKFSDGTQGLADLTNLIRERGALAKLRDAKTFAKASVDLGAVEWPGEIGIATETLYALVHHLKRPMSLDEVEKNELEVSLRELREMAKRTQVEVGESLGMDQGQLSRFERQDDRLLSTLRRYVESLGGELEVVARIGDKRMIIRGA
jgi:hypothetical protein